MSLAAVATKSSGSLIRLMRHPPWPSRAATSTEAKTSVVVLGFVYSDRPPSPTASSAATQRHHSRPSARPLPWRRRLRRPLSRWPRPVASSTAVALRFLSPPHTQPTSAEATSSAAVPWPRPRRRASPPPQPPLTPQLPRAQRHPPRPSCSPHGCPAWPRLPGRRPPRQSRGLVHRGSSAAADLDPP